MRSYLRLIMPFVAVLGMALSGCEDNEPVPTPDPDSSDPYVGQVKTLTLEAETRDFPYRDVTLRLKAPDGRIIERSGLHTRVADISTINLDSGLKDGKYEMLCLEYPTSENSLIADLAAEFPKAEFALGATIEVADGGIRILDRYDSDMGLYGEGTADNPYKISSYDALMKLAQCVNSEERNSRITSDTHFLQTDSIDMYKACRSVDRRYGWNPIGANPALPFRGHYHGNAISTLLIDRGNTAGVGLFGFVFNTSIDGIRFYNSSVKGNYGVALVVGASLMSGHERGLVTLTDCFASGCEVVGSDDSAAAGTFLGAVDINSRALVQNCTSSACEISAACNAGGIAGGCGLYSVIQLNDCKSSSSVRTRYSGAGGMVGTSDTIFVAACANSGEIIGGDGFSPSQSGRSAIGAGGLIGGSGMATVTSSRNTGTVKGYSGVGGILGSTRIKGSDTDAYMYSNLLARYCSNSGEISGKECVGGIVGESQVGTYAVYNTGNVHGDDYVAGIAGCTSVAVVHNAVNTGKVDGSVYVSGIVGKTQMGSIAIDHNYGDVTASKSHLGGIVGLAGNNTIIHYCGNYGALSSTGSGPVAGVVAEVGDPRKWTAMNIAECVVGSLEVLMAFAGPAIAVSEHFIEEAAKAVAIFLHVMEVGADASLLATDSVLLGIGISEMLEPEEVEELSAQVKEHSREINADIKSEMSSLRRGGDCSLPSVFDRNAYVSGYNGFVDSTLGYYETDGNDERFNEEINLMREERAEQLEKSHKTEEIIHNAVAGVCIAVGTVAAIGGAIASGGAAVPFIIAGSAASLAGGLNAITKSCLEFENNAVIISQCINAGEISASGGDAGGLVGRLWDRSILRDCLNSGNGPRFGSPFAGHVGNDVSISRVISLADHTSWGSVYDIDGCSLGIIYVPGTTYHDQYLADWGIVMTDTDCVADPAFYKRYDNWAVNTGEKCLWQFGSDSKNTFPVPAWSEMRK